MKCSNCGKEVPEKAKVCGYCGAKLKKPAVETPKPAPKKAASETTVPAKKTPVKKVEVKTKKLPEWTLPAGLGVIAIALVVFFVIKPSSTPETAAEIPQAKEALSSTEMDLLTGTWKGTVENIMEGGGTFVATFIFPDNCELNTYCGRVMIPEFDLDSDVMVTSVSNHKYEFFIRQNEDMPENELPDEYLKYINPTRVEFYSKSIYWDEQGMLYKQ